jgi:hypothetical protein
MPVSVAVRAVEAPDRPGQDEVAREWHLVEISCLLRHAS